MPAGPGWAAVTTPNFPIPFVHWMRFVHVTIIDFLFLQTEWSSQTIRQMFL